MNENSVILVTGSSRGLGRGIAVELARSGYSVAINYAGNVKAAEETQKLCQTAAPSNLQQFITVQGDIGVSDQRESLVGETLKQLGKIDGLVNNAGIAPRERADITEASEASFEEVLRVNLQGPYFLTQRVVRHWLVDKPSIQLRGGPKVVFVSSISAYTASVNRGEYCISKAGIAMASQLWATRLADEGVQVYELRPGIMETDMTSGVKEKYDALIANGLVPQKRWGQPQDLGLAVKSIMDGAFPFSTGEIINIDGGFHLKSL